ncbi:dethiobiotin synthase [Verrucomicrobia bacterium S94]|nr:dethiobiotin synthase [Verrucomicrobia bacterium S94]
MHGLFITGTDTDAGKTALSALLLAETRRRNINAAPMKPAQTGCRDGAVPDLDYSLSMAGMNIPSSTYQKMSVYQFEPACSPHLAAEMAGTEIDIAEMVIAARALADDFELILAEGAGGLIVPLNQRETMLDLMQALKFPVLLAARPGLGTINHTLLSIRTLRSEGLNIAGVVFVNAGNQEYTFIEENNAATIEQFGKVPILGTIPYCSQLAQPHPKYDDLPLPVIAETENIVNRLSL